MVNTPSNSVSNGDTASSLARVGLYDFVDLYTRPRLFFSGHLNLSAAKTLLPTVWILGIAAQFDRLDTEVLRHDFDVTRASWTLVEPVVTGSWIIYWAWCIAAGAAGGALLYFIGGWWFRMRLKMSGLSQDIDVNTPRQIYAYSSLVLALPHLLLTIGFTIFYPNYMAAYNSGELLSTTLPIFMFWATAVSFVGATETFSLTAWKARIWFLILPCIFYVVILGGVVWLFALLG